MIELVGVAIHVPSLSLWMFATELVNKRWSENCCLL